MTQTIHWRKTSWGPSPTLGELGHGHLMQAAKRPEVIKKLKVGQGILLAHLDFVKKQIMFGRNVTCYVRTYSAIAVIEMFSKLDLAIKNSIYCVDDAGLGNYRRSSKKRLSANRNHK